MKDKALRSPPTPKEEGHAQILNTIAMISSPTGLVMMNDKNEDENH